jgi:hypothetical protein
MKKHCLTFLLFFCAIAIYAQSEYTPELIKNFSFEEEPRPIRNRRFGPNREGELFGGYLSADVILGWFVSDESEKISKAEIVTENLADPAQSKALRWEITEGPATLVNAGNKGISAVKGRQYVLTFWARADKKYKGKLQVGLQDKRDNTWYAQTTMKGKIKKRWKKYTITFIAEGDNPKARFAMKADKAGTIYLDCVSLKVSK